MAGIFLLLGMVLGALYAPLAHTIDASGLFAFEARATTRAYKSKYALWARLWAYCPYGSPFLHRYTRKDVG